MIGGFGLGCKMSALFSILNIKDRQADGFRAQLRQILSSGRFEKAILGLIVINAITLGLETDAGINTALSPVYGAA